MASEHTPDADEIPPAAFSAWFLRRDQAEVLAHALAETVPDGPADAIYMRSGAQARAANANGWSVALDDDIEHHTREVAADLLDRLDVVDVDDVPLFAADMRHLGDDGRPAGRNEPCLCGSTRKAKKCSHPGVPMVFGSSYLLRSQPAWGAFLAAMDQERWDTAPELIPHGMYRIAVAFRTIDGATLITTTLDAPQDTDQNFAGEMAESSLADMASRRLSFLAEAHMQIQPVTTDNNPGT